VGTLGVVASLLQPPLDGFLDSRKRIGVKMDQQRCAFINPQNSPPPHHVKIIVSLRLQRKRFGLRASPV
jgi:hypothetical protein